jgi:hypothetical protein
MNPIYGLVLVFFNSSTQQVNVSGQIALFPDKASCEARLALAVPYQSGLHASDGWGGVNGWCIQVEPPK